MPYPEELVKPMRAELTRLGVEELKSAEAVDAAFRETEGGTMLLVINSVCGCAAANARPAVALAAQAPTQPDRYATVFAGQDLEATKRAREHLAGVPPSSPFMALFKDGAPVFIVERRHIEGRSASAIASDLQGAFAKHCNGAASADAPEAVETTERPEAAGSSSSSSSEEGGDGLPSTFKSIR